MKKMIFEFGITQEQNLHFITQRRNGGFLFFDNFHNEYIRFGNKAMIQKEISNYMLCEKYGLSKERIGKIILLEDFGFFYEKSVGDVSIGVKLSNGLIDYNSGFKILQNHVIHLMQNQNATIVDKINIQELERNIQFLELLTDVRRVGIISDDFLFKLYEKLRIQILQGDKFVLSHGDCNSMNILDDGLIDFEDLLFTPIGYDLITFFTHLYWFSPVEGNGRKLTFCFKYKDMMESFEQFSKISGVGVKEIFSVNFLLRGIWACSNMGEFPEEQNFRFIRFKKYAESYLNDEDIYDLFLNEVKEVEKIFFK